jgi:hypothetical protein
MGVPPWPPPPDPPDRPQPGDALIMERPGTWFAVYHD